MTQLQMAVIDPVVKGKLLDALAVYFLNENYKLGLGLEAQQISDICQILLSGNEDLGDHSDSWQISDQTIFEEYQKEELEIMDYLHLVTLERRKQLGQYSTPISIVRYIFKSVEYTSFKDILDKRLLDPACGSGAFLVEAARVYLNALKRGKIALHKWYPMLISTICGIDIDPQACFFAR